MTIKKLQSFNAWGMVSVEKNAITVILSSITADGRQLKRTLKAETTKKVPAGLALLAINIGDKTHDVQASEQGDEIIASHPSVLKVIKTAIDWIRASL
jgi:hypothetical protein